MGSKAIRLAAATAAVLALCVAGAAAQSGGRASATRSVVLGKTPTYPASGCPGASGCEVIAKVTGIQMKADGVDHPFRVPADGKLVSWWLKLPRLYKSQLRSFNGLFGGDPAARIVVLRRGKRARFRLIRQSPTQGVRRDIGKKGRARYTLAQPLRVKQGDYIGLTVVSWLPAFAVGLDGPNNTWLASRARDRCDTPPASRPKKFAAYYRRSDAQLETSPVKVYQCSYATARLLYWARIVKDAEEPAQPPG